MLQEMVQFYVKNANILQEMYKTCIILKPYFKNIIIIINIIIK